MSYVAQRIRALETLEVFCHLRDLMELPNDRVPLYRAAGLAIRLTKELAMEPGGHGHPHFTHGLDRGQVFEAYRYIDKVQTMLAHADAGAL